MDYFEWNSSMETGIEIIDAQHREITRHVNTVYHAVCLKERALEEASMRELFACIEEHLQFEEELLDAAGYPGLNAHRRSHGKFRQRLHRYFATFIDGNDVSLALLADLRMWLTTHIRYDDTAYASHLLQQLAPGVPMQQKNRFTPVSSLFARRAPPYSAA